MLEIEAVLEVVVLSVFVFEREKSETDVVRVLAGVIVAVSVVE